MTDTFTFRPFEKILITAGFLFFGNVVWISLGGGFEILYVAKAVYLLGIIILATEL